MKLIIKSLILILLILGSEVIETKKAMKNRKTLKSQRSFWNGLGNLMVGFISGLGGNSKWEDCIPAKLGIAQPNTAEHISDLFNELPKVFQILIDSLFLDKKIMCVIKTIISKIMQIIKGKETVKKLFDKLLSSRKRLRFVQKTEISQRFVQKTKSKLLY